MHALAADRVVHDVLPAKGEDIADAQAGHAGERRNRLQHGLLAGCLGRFVEFFKRKVLLGHVLGLDLFEEVVDVGADHSVAVEDLQESAKRGSVTRSGVARDASLALELVDRQQVLAELVTEVDVYLLENHVPMQNV